ncbi:MAG: hypothetical protein MH204_10500 [Fimbriimonadaceae bacterium]|nr:hypothetical protein [Fimbriimonadaceae bacterium]
MLVIVAAIVFGIEGSAIQSWTILMGFFVFLAAADWVPQKVLRFSIMVMILIAAPVISFWLFWREPGSFSSLTVLCMLPFFAIPFLRIVTHAFPAPEKNRYDDC